MYEEVINQIFTFNLNAGLLELGYDDERECAFPIEEAFEGFPSIANPKMYSRSLIADAITPDLNISDVDRFDKHLDIIVFSFGSLFKLGLTPNQVIRGLNKVMEANLQKLNVGKDKAGKQQKPMDFIGPELELQNILDERR